MDADVAMTRIDLIGLGAAAELCSHVDQGACERCSVSIVGNLWEAVGVVVRSRVPIPVLTRVPPVVAPHER